MDEYCPDMTFNRGANCVELQSYRAEQGAGDFQWKILYPVDFQKHSSLRDLVAINGVY
jgi:hypothetical protein